MRIDAFKKKKDNKEKISLLTCYDFSMAQILNETPVDALLVGDSVAQVQHGYETTLAATPIMMEWHTCAVAKGAPKKFIISDLPFGSYRKGRYHAIEVSERLMRAGAAAVKLEGVVGHEEVITHLIQSGVPVMGHLGLTPQFVNTLGGYKVQGRDAETASELMRQAALLEELGVFSLVLECVPKTLAKEIAQSLKIPVIGIGAGPEVDGQVLVINDLLGFSLGPKLKFVRRFAQGQQWVQKSVSDFVQEIQSGDFPSQEESFE